MPSASLRSNDPLIPSMTVVRDADDGEEQRDLRSMRSVARVFSCTERVASGQCPFCSAVSAYIDTYPRNSYVN